MVHGYSFSFLRPLRAGWSAALLLLGCVLLSARPAQAQAEWSRWYFGQQAGLQFQTGSTSVLADNRLDALGSCATLCDSTGQLLLYSNGGRVLNGRHQLLLDGATLGGDSAASQGCTLLPQPGLRGRYYLFTLGSWRSFPKPYRGLRVAEIDLTAAGGQGRVLRTNQPVVPDSLLLRLGSTRFLEAQALVRHPNGRDYWLITHLFDSNAFLSVLVDGRGFGRSATVVSRVGLVRSATAFADLPGSLAVTADGRRLALTTLITGAEVFDFDPSTGRVSNPLFIRQGVYSAGVAFSPSGSLLYVSRQGPAFGTGCPSTANARSEVWQYDLRLATPAAIAASGQAIYSNCGSQVWGLQRAPDGRIYVANLREYTSLPPTTLDYIGAPNVRGAGCQYVAAGVQLGAGRAHRQQFPVVPGGLPQPRLEALIVPTACVGQVLTFGASGATLGAPGDTLDWSFGDGATLRTSLPQATHAYARAGSYPLVVRLRNRPLGPPEQLAATVQVQPAPTVSLGPDVVLCAGSVAQLSVGALPAGATVRWHDGLTTPTRPASTAGLYWAEVTSAAGCTARDTVLVQLAGTNDPALHLQASALLCPGRPVALGPDQPQLAGSQYRWQDGSTTYSFVASTPGTYTLRVTTPAGCERTASLVLNYAADCGASLPTVITPNGDKHNEAFVLDGLTAADWSIAIYNRWGREVLRQASYDNAWNAAGHSAGIYYYLLTNRQTGAQRKGWVEVVK